MGLIRKNHQLICTIEKIDRVIRFLDQNGCKVLMTTTFDGSPFCAVYFRSSSRRAIDVVERMDLKDEWNLSVLLERKD